ncbi:hypothetical protein [Mesorhizobium sp. M0306]|uniref:hypothetical protein n=1 Tax=unclassified Mesorhizobium TaxID=325217 RepID=UPI003334E223
MFGTNSLLVVLSVSQRTSPTRKAPAIRTLSFLRAKIPLAEMVLGDIYTKIDAISDADEKRRLQQTLTSKYANWK